MKYFETRFLKEADKFIAELDPQIAKKVFYNIDLAEQTIDQGFSKNFKIRFGNFGHCILGAK